MAKLAAPHSNASICMITGTFAIPFLTGCFTLFSAIDSPRQFHRKLMGVVDSSTSSAS